MCTVSWIRSRNGYELFCNRDEKHERAPALGPAIHQGQAGDRAFRYIAPMDGHAGGTWISANDAALSLCLLNGAALSGSEGSLSDAGRPLLSRGCVIRQLAGISTIDEVVERLQAMPLQDFDSFTVVALQPQRPTGIFEWNRRTRFTLLDVDGFTPLVSSSYDPVSVRMRRLWDFKRRGKGHRPDASELFAFHASHSFGESAYSTCMHREDASTKSLSWITVDSDQIRFLHIPGSPCEQRSGQTVLLPRESGPCQS